MSVGVGLSVYSGLGAATVGYLDAVAAPFDSLWFPDHLQSNPEGVMEGWTLFTHSLARYPDKVCGHQVLCNEFRHPAHLAKMAATAQVLSGGRVVLGIGAGWLRSEAEAYGLDFPTTPARVARLREAVTLVRQLWTGEPVTIEGDHYRVREAVCTPSPHPPPPVMIGGSGERHVLAAVADHADWWNHIYRDLEEFSHKRRVLRAHCEAGGRDPEEILSVIGTQVLIADRESELDRMRAHGAVRAVDRNGLAGTPEQIGEALGAAVDRGAGMVIVGFADSPRPEGTELFAREVLPGLTGRSTP